MHCNFLDGEMTYFAPKVKKYSVTNGFHNHGRAL